MVLAGEDDTLHARVLGGADDLVGVEVGRVEDLLALVAVAPFSIRERVHGEVQKAVELHLVPAKLTFRGYGTPRCRNGHIGLSGRGRGDEAHRTDRPQESTGNSHDHLAFAHDMTSLTQC